MDTSSRKTEIMGAPDNRSTMIMDGMNGGSRATEIMTGVPLPVSPAMSAGIEIDGYKIESVLAENTGEATLLLGKKQDVLYVLKIYHQKKRPKGDLIEKIRRIDSEYVIASVADGEYDGRFYEVLPYFKNGDLIANLPISEKTIEEVVVPCVNEGLHSLHEQEIVHRDVKPSNIFFDNDKKKAVIGDFGISSVLKENMSVRATSMSRTLGYAAPETSAGFISKESDYYSFGITLWHLVLGQDPFLGMNDMQILYQTINKKISLPQTVTPRLSKLIYGLTAKDRNERWGYEQVCAWLNHADAKLPEAESESFEEEQPEKGYSFCDGVYTNLKDLSLAFAHNWEEAKKDLYRGVLEERIGAFDQYLPVQCSQLMTIRSEDYAIFRLIYLLNPDAPLCYRGQVYGDLEEFGKMLAERPDEIAPIAEEMALNGSLSYFMEFKRYDHSYVSAVESVAERLRHGEKEFAHALRFLLYPQQGFSLDGEIFTALSDLCGWLNGLSDALREEKSEVLVNSKEFLMWIFSLGYEEQLTEWKKLMEKAEWE